MPQEEENSITGTLSCSVNAAFEVNSLETRAEFGTASSCLNYDSAPSAL